MTNIPMDLVEDIFLRLPATTLVRCRVLSKPCLSLIDSHEFITSHLKRTLETQQHLMILLRGPDVLRTVYLDSPDKSSNLIEHPFLTNGSTQVFGSCNGLVGLVNSPNDLAVFNPSTRKLHRLPFEPICFPEQTIFSKNVFYGLVYDSVNDEYKVVRLVQTNITKKLISFPFEVKVFSLKSNSWKEIILVLEVWKLFVGFHYSLLDRCGNRVLAGNSIHWHLRRSPALGQSMINTIIRFDLAAEELVVLDIPRDFFYRKRMVLGLLDGCLCVMLYNKFSHVDIWIMREYDAGGGSESWSKLCTVPKPESVETFENLRPMVYSKDRSKILIEINNNAQNLMWFDLVSKTFTRVMVKGCDSLCSAEIVVSSLVMGCKRKVSEKEGGARGGKMTQKRKKNGDGFMSKGSKLKL